MTARTYLMTLACAALLSVPAAAQGTANLPSLPLFSTEYTVKAGDTLYSIARAFGTTPEALIALNALPGTTLEISQVLRVQPGVPRPSPVTFSSTLISLPTELPTNVTPLPVKPTVAPISVPANDPTYTTYTVKAKDTLYSIAKAFGSSTEALARLNNLTSSTVDIGQVLKVPRLKPAPAAPPSTPGVSAVPGRPAASGPVRGPVAVSGKPTATHAGMTFTPTSTGAIPTQAFLDGMPFAFQTYNNCGPSAVSAVLGYYGVNVNQHQLRPIMRPQGGYMQVQAIAPVVARYGLKSTVMRGGKISQIKRLVSAGIPVIVLQWYDRPGHIPHFRVVRGFDDAAGVMWVSDSMVGNVAYLPYAHFDALWNTQGRQFVPVYRAANDTQVKALLRN